MSDNTRGYGITAAAGCREPRKHLLMRAEPRRRKTYFLRLTVDADDLRHLPLGRDLAERVAARLASLPERYRIETVEPWWPPMPAGPGGYE